MDASDSAEAIDPAADPATRVEPDGGKSDPDGRQRFEQRWQRECGRPSSDDTRPTLSGIPLAPVYGPPADGDAHDPDRIGWPGEYPFTRGIYTTGYRGKPWTIRQFAGFGSASDTNARFHRLLEGGADGISVAFDMPTLMGLDSDHARAAGEVGHCGVAIDSAADMQRLLADIPLDAVTTSMTISGPARPAVLHLRRCRRACRHRTRVARRHPADGHLQGVHRAEGVGLPTRAASAPDR